MKYQARPYSCGAAAIVNALRCYGRRVSEKRVAALAGTNSKEGTNELGIISALNQLGFAGVPFEYSDEGIARGMLTKLCPAIICTQSLQHWVTVIGVTDRGYILVDPARTIRNKKENGIHILTWAEMKRTWQTRQQKFYGIAVAKR